MYESQGLALANRPVCRPILRKSIQTFCCHY